MEEQIQKRIGQLPIMPRAQVGNFKGMEEQNLQTCSFLVKFVLLLQLVNYINNLKLEAEATQSELYHRMSNVEAQNRHHEK